MSKKKTKAPKTKFEANWRFKTLEALEKNNWGEPFNSSDLVVTCYRLRKKPLHEFTPEDLNTMIGQNLGLKHLMPLALEILQQNILTDAFYYEGDLLRTVLNAEKAYWLLESENHKTIIELFEANIENLKAHDTVDSIREGWFTAFEKIKNLHQ